MVIQQLLSSRRGATARYGATRVSTTAASLYHVKIILFGALFLFLVTFTVLDDNTTSSTFLLTSTLEEYQQAIHKFSKPELNDISMIREGRRGNKKEEKDGDDADDPAKQQQPWEGFTQRLVDAQQQPQLHRKIKAVIANGGQTNKNAEATAIITVTESDYDHVDHNHDERVRDETKAREQRTRHHHHHQRNAHRQGKVRTTVVYPPHRNVLLDGFITRHESVSGDPLRDPHWDSSAARPLPFSPKTQYLGVLVDAGRHYFPIPWLYNLIDRLADMKYNLIHLRLTDDQAWNVLLEHTPSLASPSHVDNPDLRVYTVPELRALVAYGKEHGISFMPEINVPGHGGAWAAALNGTAIVQCPEFICEKGYGVPINITNPAIFSLIESIIREIIDIFEDPPFLHLGGDEVDMARPCFQEIGQDMPNFQDFEDELRNLVVHKIGYPDERIVRWEMTGQASLRRVGDVEQFWFSFPDEPRSRYRPGSPFMISTHLYFDTNGEAGCWEVYGRADRGINLQQDVGVPIAIVAATFELSPTFWFDRNVLGRLLSVAMGAAQIHIQENITYDTTASYGEMQAGLNGETHNGLNAKFEEYCNILGLGPKICQTQGRPVITTTEYQAKWKRGWDVWKNALCHRLTNASDTRVFRHAHYQTVQARTAALEFFADNFASESAGAINDDDRAILAYGLLPEPWAALGRHDKDKAAEFAGVIFDLTTSQPSVSELKVMLEEFVAKLGLNAVQLRFAGRYGWTFQNSVQQVVDYHDSHAYTAYDLQKIDDNASKLGLQVIPEISVSSDANGFHPTGLVAKCPIRFCQEGVPWDISNKIVPFTIFSQVATLRKSFPMSRFLHLGSDERQASLPCFEEAAATISRTAASSSASLSDFDAFENRLSKMLQLGGDVELAHVLRWDNGEHKRYTQRTGNITHYRSGADASQIRMDDGPFFVTVDLLEKKLADGSTVSAWDIYERARSLVNAKPMGIMAEIGTVTFEAWEEWEIPQRILAFSMAVSQLPVLKSETAFISTFTSICQATLNLEPCTPPEDRRESLPKREASRNNDDEDDELLSRTTAQCEAATIIQERRIMKLGTPAHYNDTGKQLLLDQPSKATWSLS